MPNLISSCTKRRCSSRLKGHLPNRYHQPDTLTLPELRATALLSIISVHIKVRAGSTCTAIKYVRSFTGHTKHSIVQIKKARRVNSWQTVDLAAAVYKCTDIVCILLYIYQYISTLLLHGQGVVTSQEVDFRILIFLRKIQYFSYCSAVEDISTNQDVSWHWIICCLYFCLVCSLNLSCSPLSYFGIFTLTTYN